MTLEQEPYPFADGNLLEKPNTYFYSTYKGSAFLISFFQHRLRTLENLPSASPAPTPHPEVEPPSKKIIETERLLEYVFSKILKGEINDSSCQFWLERLVKKFEVSKRIHIQYKQNFCAVDPNQHKNYCLYIRLSEIFESAYANSGDIRFLNVLLKTIDTICSFSEYLISQDRRRLASLIFKEKEHIENMIQQKGLKHAFD